MTRHLKQSEPRSVPRRGAATIELAVCLPVLVLILLGSLEAANLMFTRQAMVQTAYEAVRVATKPDGTNQAALDAADRVSLGRNLANVSITFTPGDVSAVPAGQPIRVTAEVPAASGKILRSNIIGTQTVVADAVMIKE